MTRRRTMGAAALAGALVSAVVVAVPAWSGSGTGHGRIAFEAIEAAAGPAASLTAKQQEQLRAHAERHVACMRAKGFDLADPVVSEAGVAALDDIDVTELDAASAECLAKDASEIR